MTNASALLEALISPIVDLVIRALPDKPDEDLAQWAAMHGWNGNIDRYVVAHQAALNLILRALIWHVLHGDALPNIVSSHLILTESANLLQSLKGISLPPSYLDSLATQAGGVLRKEDIATLAAALQHKGSDIIGDAYTSWISSNARRPLGQFWTPPPIAQLMVKWAIRLPNERVLDPAFGSGILLLYTLERLIELGVPAERASRQISGVELSPLAFLMGLSNVLLRYPSARPRLQWGDFLVPDREPPPVLKEAAATYASMQGQQMVLPGMEITAPTAFPEQFDAIVCNPPYTRHHHLPQAYKSTWMAVMKQEYGIKLSRFSSLFAYFLVQATRMLAPTGRMAFITPITVFEASYSRQVKAFIQRQLRLRALITFDESLSVFEGVDTAACITLLEGLQTPAKKRAVHVKIYQWPGAEPVLETIERGSASIDWGTIHEIDPSTLKPRQKWTIVGRENDHFSKEAFIPLSDIARIVRGIATGANDFFALSDSEVAEWGLGRTNLRPVLTKTREAPGYLFSQVDFDRLGREGKKRWLLYLTGPVTPDTAEARYIQHGEARGLHERSLVKTRPLWYVMEQRDPAPIYFTYLSRKRSRFIYNQANVLALNVFLCVYPIPVISQDETMLKALLAVLNSLVTKDSLRHIGRTYGGDTIKVEPREMDQLPVLNPVKLTPDERKQLGELFDRLCCAGSEEHEQAIRRAIDEKIVTIAYR